jgi:hypothetical protein
MASFIAIPPATVAGQVAIPAVAFPRLTTTNVTSATPPVVTDSITVTLSAAARVLAALDNQSVGANPALEAAQNTGPPPPIPSGADVSAQSAFTATLALQALLDDPGLRAIRNQADPLYSALIAASHLSDFVPAAVIGANPNAIVADIPTPVTPAAASRAIDFYRQTAAEFRPLSNA